MVPPPPEPPVDCPRLTLMSAAISASVLGLSGSGCGEVAVAWPMARAAPEPADTAVPPLFNAMASAISFSVATILPAY